MEYDWDIEKLRLLKRKLKKISFNEKLSVDELNEVNIEIINLEEMINIEKNSKHKIIIDDNEYKNKFYDKNKLLSLANYYKYKAILPYIKNSFNEISCMLGKYNDRFVITELPSFKSKEELIKMGYEVYSNLPTNKEIYKYLYLKYTNPNNKYLKGINNINSDDYISGYSYFFNHPKYTAYTLIAFENKISDLEILNHEIAHMIFFNPNVTTYNRSYYLQEVEGYYFEYLTRKYLRKKYSSHVVDQLEYNKFNTILDEVFNYYVVDLLIKKNKKDPNMSKEEMLEYLIYKTEEVFKYRIISELDIMNALTSNTFFYSKYLVSYLTYLDIKEISKRDPEFGLYIFEKVCKIRNDYFYSKLKKLGITYMDDGYANLDKTIKKMNKLR